MKMKSKKPKAVPVKKSVKSLRPPISDSSLNFLPDDAVEGFQERIESGVEWTLYEQAARHHRKKCTRDEISPLTFSDALQGTIKKSILYGFLEDNNVSLQERWESLLAMDLWNKENIDTEEKDPCLRKEDFITDDLFKLIKKAVLLNDRNVLREELQLISVLRLIDAKVTTLDEDLRSFKNLSTLNLACNFITDFNSNVLPRDLKMLELQSNAIRKIDEFVENAPESLIFLGLSGNLLCDECNLKDISKLVNITVLDLSDNDICDLSEVLNSLVELPKLTSLMLIGNPCAVCAAYAKTTMKRIPQLKWLDNHEIMDSDRPSLTFEPHPHDLRSSYFNFTVCRIFYVPEPPKLEKGYFQLFHVELELPLLDSTRRKFLMYRQNEELTEILQPSEDDQYTKEASSSELFISNISSSKSFIYNNLERNNSRVIRHYTVFESNKVQWSRIMGFQEPTVRILCPNLVALRDTFRSVITVKLVYTLSESKKEKSVSRVSKKSSFVMLKHVNEHRVTLATVRCAPRQPRWWATTQRFCWDSTLGSDEANCCSDELKQQYNIARPKPSSNASKLFLPEQLTCIFSFDIDTI